MIKNAVLEKYPWVALSMFDAWQESKQECYRWLDRQRVHQTGLWYRSLWEEERAIAGGDPYVWGFKKRAPKWTRCSTIRFARVWYREDFTLTMCFIQARWIRERKFNEGLKWNLAK